MFSRKTRFFRVVLASALAFAATAGAANVYEDGYAAMVNKNVITVSDVLAAIEPVEKQLRETLEGAELRTKLEELYRQGLDALIERELILADFEAQKGELPDRIIEDEVNNVIRERFDNNRIAFYNALAEERLTLTEWKEEIRKRLIVSILRRREVTERIALSPQALRDAYEGRVDQYRVPEKVHLRAIILQKGTNETDLATKRSEAESIRARVEAGEDFAQLAKTESEGIKATQGGDLGWVEPASLRSELAGPVAELQPNRVSPVIETQDELWIVRLEGRKNASVVPFEEVEKELADELRKKEAERLSKAWIARLKRKNFVKIFPPSGALPPSEDQATP